MVSIKAEGEKEKGISLWLSEVIITAVAQVAGCGVGSIPGLGTSTWTKRRERSFRCGTAETNPTSNHEVVGSTPGLAQWVKDRALL